MPELNGIKCPVCGNEFADGDDVVFCPDCGTPHHRECYKLAGHCVNAGLHHTGFNFYDENIKTDKKPEKAENKVTSDGYYIPENKESDKSGEAPSTPFVPVIPKFESEYKGQTIGGEKAEYYAAAVRTNTNRFLGLFKKFEGGKKKSGWNWGALIFGPYYLLFRKMYPQGIGLLIIQTLVSYLSSYFMSSLAPKFTDAVTTIMKAKAGSAFSAMTFTNADVEALQNSGDFGVAAEIFFITAGILILLRIITAVFADRIYFSTVTNLIKNVNEKINDSVSVTTMPSMFNPTAQEISGENAKLFYLSRKGGTSLFPALIGYMAISFLTTL